MAASRDGVVRGKYTRKISPLIPDQEGTGTGWSRQAWAVTRATACAGLLVACRLPDALVGCSSADRNRRVEPAASLCVKATTCTFSDLRWPIGISIQRSAESCM